MKLKLSQEKDISILDVLEEVSVQNVSVLRAGVTKLLQSGKSKIILNLGESKKISLESVIEIIKLHMTGTENKGEVVLVGQTELVRQAIKGLNPPPSVRCYPSKEAAINAFGDTITQPVAPSFAGSDAELKDLLTRLEAENKKLKAQVESRKADDVKKVQLENSSMQQQIAVLEEQLKLYAKENKKPFEMESLQVKIQQIETTMTEVLQKENLLPQSG